MERYAPYFFAKNDDLFFWFPYRSHLKYVEMASGYF